MLPLNIIYMTCTGRGAFSLQREKKIRPLVSAGVLSAGDGYLSRARRIRGTLGHGCFQSHIQYALMPDWHMQLQLFLASPPNCVAEFVCKSQPPVSTPDSPFHQTPLEDVLHWATANNPVTMLKIPIAGFSLPRM
jgi:hypothetical protein